MYLLWETPSVETREFSALLRHNISQDLYSAGAGSLRFNIIDDDIEATWALHQMNTLIPIDAMASIWIDSAICRLSIELSLADIADAAARYEP